MDVAAPLAPLPLSMPLTSYNLFLTSENICNRPELRGNHGDRGHTATKTSDWHPSTRKLKTRSSPSSSSSFLDTNYVHLSQDVCCVLVSLRMCRDNVWMLGLIAFDTERSRFCCGQQSLVLRVAGLHDVSE
jgi:hypothetical protein